MQVKVFEAPDMATGLRMVKKELGPDALILSTKTVRNKKRGFLGKPMLEITAARDNDFSETTSPLQPHTITKQTTHSATLPGRAAHRYQQNSMQKHDHLEETAAFRNHLLHKPDDTETHTEEPHSAKDRRNTQLQEQVNDLKNMILSLHDEISRIKSKPEPEDQQSVAEPIIQQNRTSRQQGQQQALTSPLDSFMHSHESTNLVATLLNRHGINRETVQVISSFAKEQLSEQEREQEQVVIPFLQSTLSELLTVSPIDFQQTGQKRIALIGPTGVGKTTTIAKLAAKHMANVSKSIALITLDTYRIAAVEQLKVYGEIMRLPVEVVITASQLQEAISKHSDKDCILIDTAGRSHFDDSGIEQLISCFHPSLQIENHLVLSATTKDEEIVNIIDKFSIMNIESTLFTKTDECATLGVILNTQIKKGLPISYITNGQRVPEDILESNRNDLAQLIIPYEQEMNL